MELNKLSLDELLTLQHRIAAEIDSRHSAEKAKAQQEILALAGKYGLSVKFAGGSTAPGKAAKGKRAVVAPKYRNPANGAETWTGRGRSPVWVAEWKAKHGSLDGIIIK